MLLKAIVKRAYLTWEPDENHFISRFRSLLFPTPDAFYEQLHTAQGTALRPWWFELSGCEHHKNNKSIFRSCLDIDCERNHYMMVAYFVCASLLYLLAEKWEETTAFQIQYGPSPPYEMETHFEQLMSSGSVSKVPLVRMKLSATFRNNITRPGCLRKRKSTMSIRSRELC